MAGAYLKPVKQTEWQQLYTGATESNCNSKYTIPLITIMMNSKTAILMILSVMLIGSALADEAPVPLSRHRRQQGPIRQLLRPLLGRPIFNQGVVPIRGGGPVQPGLGGFGGLGNANAAGAGNGIVQDNTAIGTGTGIANAGPGGFGIGLGIGAAVATPIGNFALGEGQSLSVGK